jgi:hypothetical protein
LRYSRVLEYSSDEYVLDQGVYESETEYIFMERSIDEVLECERDAVSVELAASYLEQ